MLPPHGCLLPRQDNVTMDVAGGCTCLLPATEDLGDIQGTVGFSVPNHALLKGPWAFAHRLKFAL